MASMGATNSMKEAYLMAWGNIFTLEQLHKQLHIPKSRKLADELFHLLLDHLLVEDFPNAGVPPGVTEKLKGMIERAKAGIPEMVEKLERGEEPTGEEAYERALSGANGFLWGKILNPQKGSPPLYKRIPYPGWVQPRYPDYKKAFGWGNPNHLFLPSPVVTPPVTLEKLAEWGMRQIKKPFPRD